MRKVIRFQSSELGVDHCGPYLLRFGRRLLLEDEERRWTGLWMKGEWRVEGDC